MTHFCCTKNQNLQIISSCSGRDVCEVKVLCIHGRNSKSKLISAVRTGRRSCFFSLKFSTSWVSWSGSECFVTSCKADYTLLFAMCFKWYFYTNMQLFPKWICGVYLGKKNTPFFVCTRQLALKFCIHRSWVIHLMVSNFFPFTPQ